MTALALTAPREGAWLFGRNVDLLVFGGSAALSIAIVASAALTGTLDREVPTWMFVTCILAVDVAHVWSTIFRVYLDRASFRERPVLYVAAPIVIYAVGAVLHAFSAHAFWRALAYLAVFHFVRQQYGWVSLYRRKAGETSDRILDTVAIYSATIYPLLYWHAHLPRHFDWFVENDFVVGLSADLVAILTPVYWTILAVFVARQGVLYATGKVVNGGKVLVVTTTWFTWWLGIVALDSDLAFTVTNVLTHGLPYLVLTYAYGKKRAESGAPLLRKLLAHGAAGFVLVVLALAFVEEALWDRLVFHDRPALFGEGASLSALAVSLVAPLLAVPQATHYVLDGVLWRRRS